MTEQFSRRRALGLAAGAGAALALAGCGFTGSGTTQAATKKQVKAEVDGDLVYFNWADYIDRAYSRDSARSTA
jgi:spermidine/putrescine transport system substrate-binding protein